MKYFTLFLLITISHLTFATKKFATKKNVYLEGPVAEEIFENLIASVYTDCEQPNCDNNFSVTYFKIAGGLICFHFMSTKKFSCHGPDSYSGSNAQNTYRAMDVEAKPVVARAIPSPPCNHRFCNTYQKQLGPITCFSRYIGRTYPPCDNPVRCSKAPKPVFNYKCQID